MAGLPVVIAPLDGVPVATIADVAPPASLALLSAVAHLVNHACTAPYPVVGLAFDGRSSAPATGSDWYWQQRINVGTQALRGRFTRSVDPGSTGVPEDQRSVTTTGSGAVDIPPAGAVAVGTEQWPIDPIVAIMPAAETWDTGSTGDRLYELTAGLSPYNEGFSGHGLVGFGGNVSGYHIADMQTL